MIQIIFFDRKLQNSKEPKLYFSCSKYTALKHPFEFTIKMKQLLKAQIKHKQKSFEHGVTTLQTSYFVSGNMSEEHKIREKISLTCCFVIVHYILYIAENVALLEYIWDISGCIAKRKHLEDKPYINCHRFINIKPIKQQHFCSALK